jgi:hypothetical protein
MTAGWPASMTETTEFVVPRSIPITLPGIVGFSPLQKMNQVYDYMTVNTIYYMSV